VIGYLSDEQHERLWRVCDALVSGAGARAAMVCDASNGAVIVSVGDASAQGAVSSVEALGPGERVVHGEGGNIYGVDIVGGALLAVLYDEGTLEKIRAAAAQAVVQTSALLAELPLPQPESHAHHAHPQVPAAPPAKPRSTRPRKKAASKKAHRPATRRKPVRKIAKKSARKAAPRRKPRPKPRRR